MHAGRRHVCQSWAGYSVPAYCYRFDTGHMAPPPLPFGVGAAHFQEAAFVFKSSLGVGYGTPPFASPDPVITERLEKLSTAVSSMWARFIVDLNPNGRSLSIPWPEYTLDGKENLLVFDANLTKGYERIQDNYREEAIAYMISLHKGWMR